MKKWLLSVVAVTLLSGCRANRAPGQPGVPEGAASAKVDSLYTYTSIADDPEGGLPAGYSIVNLDKEPFSVSQTPKRTVAVAGLASNCCCCALIWGDKKPTKTVAKAATEMACTTKRVLLSSEAPRGSRSNGMLLMAVT